MNAPFLPRVGGVLSADIAVPDHERMVRFYARVLGTGEHPLWRDDLMNAQGTPVIGLGARGDAYAELPLQWMPHVQVADVRQSVERALELGGKELMHAREDGVSQWAVLLDPDGAAFGLIPIVSEDEVPADGGAGPGVGRIAWLDLTVADAARTRDFYREVVGWSVQDVPMQDARGSYADYAMLDEDGTAAAGVCHARGANQDLPPVWLLYLPVGDLAESLRRAQAGGGTIVKEATTDDGDQAYAVIQDPAGAYFALLPA